MKGNTNDFIKPAVTDVDQSVDGSAGLADVANTAEVPFGEKLSVLEATVTRHPLNREVLYRFRGTPFAPILVTYMESSMFIQSKS